MRNNCLLLSLVFVTCMSGAVAATGANLNKVKLPPAQEIPASPEPVVVAKPLDLSVPFRENQASKLTFEAKSEAVIQKSSLFDAENQNKTRDVQLDGKLLMTQEQEVEKRKTIDGAGIVINLRR